MAQHHHMHIQHHDAPHSHPHCSRSTSVHEHRDYDFKEVNKNHFNEHAHQYDDRPAAQELARRLGAAMIGAYPFNEDSTFVLDYACGTGWCIAENA